MNPVGRSEQFYECEHVEDGKPPVWSPISDKFSEVQGSGSSLGSRGWLVINPPRRESSYVTLITDANGIMTIPRLSRRSAAKVNSCFKRV